MTDNADKLAEALGHRTIEGHHIRAALDRLGFNLLTDEQLQNLGVAMIRPGQEAPTFVDCKTGKDSQ